MCDNMILFDMCDDMLHHLHYLLSWIDTIYIYACLFIFLYLSIYLSIYLSTLQCMMYVYIFVGIYSLALVTLPAPLQLMTYSPLHVLFWSHSFSLLLALDQ